MFLPYHRASLAKAGMPKQNGETHASAGDVRSQEASFVLKTNDPAGFTIVDVRAALGLMGLEARRAGSAVLLVPSESGRRGAGRTRRGPCRPGQAQGFALHCLTDLCALASSLGCR